MSDSPIISLSDISYVFGKDGGANRVLDSVNFAVEPGEFFILLGPSGCGKSTLLRIVAGILRSSQGTVAFQPKKVQGRIAMVFQGFAIFPWFTVFENIAFGLRMRKASETKIREVVDFYLSELGLREVAQYYPRELSGGMRQRVGIARALAVDPEILLLDEPFSQLDAYTADKLRGELLTLWRKEKFTVIMVTHLIEEAVLLGDRIAVMTPKPGKIEGVVENTLPRPRNDRDPAFWKIEDELAAIVRY